MQNNSIQQNGFSKDQRSSFSYWFAHWCAFNMTALVHHAWKFKYLFHDFEKPWLRLIWPYKKVQQFHRLHNAHHTQYKGGVYKFDYEAMLIDWECSRFTKQASPRTAREMFPNELAMAKEHMNSKELAYFEDMLNITANKLNLL